MSKINIVAVDFDGTLTHTPFGEDPRIDVMAASILIKFQKNGGHVILWTCRYGAELLKALAACKKKGLCFDAVNEDDPKQVEDWMNSPFNKDRSKESSPKVFADLYIDDKSPEALLYGGIDWTTIDVLINNQDEEVA